MKLGFLLQVVAITFGASTSTASSKLPSGKIKHVVLLMEENRSFDHMMGFFKGVNGLTGKETNPFNTSDPKGKTIKVGNTSPYVGPFDPNHSVGPTTQKIFGQQCLNEGCTTPTMDGFVEFEAQHHTDPSSVMNMFTPERLPVMAALAEEFLVMDEYFCSVPGPTWPNRLFQLLATSEGDTATTEWNPDTFIYTAPSIFEMVEKAGLDWRFYFADAPLEMAMVEKLLFSPEKVKGWPHFKRDMREGTLPAFSWVNPRWFVNKTSGLGASDQHPDHDVALGEALLKELYEDLRASPAWNDTLFIVTYDEHGGFYDHVPPPMGVPAPDDKKSYPDDFDFTRLGVRIPTLLISPWVKKGSVVSKPDGPEPTSAFDLTSVIASVRNLFNITSGPLTRRDAWAGTFDHHLNEALPRADCPMTLPDPPPPSMTVEQEGNQPLNHLQEDIIRAFARLRGGEVAESPLPVLQGEASEWMEKVVADVLAGNHVFASRVPAPAV